MLAALLREPGVEERLSLGSRFGFMALHGGSLERGTAEIAELAAARAGASLYAIVQPEDLRWHIPSAQFDPDASPSLRSFLDHVDVVVSVHGFGRRELWTALLVGGGNRELASRAAGALRTALPAYRVVDDLAAIPSSLRGLHPANPVNRCRGGGIQIELPPRVRDAGRQRADRETLVSVLTSLA